MKTYRILCFGDSLTEGWYEDGNKFHPYTFRLIEMLNEIEGVYFDVINKGKSCEIVSQEMILRLPAVLNSIEKPDLVIILGGTNDLENIGDFKQKTLATEIIKLHNICHEQGIVTCALTMPEIAPGYLPMTEEYTKMWNETNEDIRLFTKENNNVFLCDLALKHPMFSLTEEDKHKLWDDDIHYTPSGYDKMGEIIYEHIMQYIPAQNF